MFVEIARVMFYLEDLLGQPVDLLTENALREELRPHIEREALGLGAKANGTSSPAWRRLTVV